MFLLTSLKKQIPSNTLTSALCIAVAMALTNSYAGSVKINHKPEKSAYFPYTVLDGAPKVKPGTAIKNLKLLPDFYQTPKMPFIVDPGEQVVQVSIKSCTGEEAQKILNDERKFVPGAILVVNVEELSLSQNNRFPLGKRHVSFSAKEPKLLQPVDVELKSSSLLRILS
jgi:hypothetical protein